MLFLFVKKSIYHQNFGFSDQELSKFRCLRLKLWISGQNLSRFWFIRSKFWISGQNPSKFCCFKVIILVSRTKFWFPGQNLSKFWFIRSKFWISSKNIVFFKFKILVSRSKFVKSLVFESQNFGFSSQNCSVLR